MKECIHCKAPNSEGWFYCRTCGNKASVPKFTTNLYMRSEIGKRTDIEFSTTTHDKEIDKTKKERIKNGQKFWNSKVKEFNKGRYA